MSDATCGTCPSYSVFRAPVSGERPCPNGECRRYPPLKVNPRWPSVYGDTDWCSEHPDRYQPLVEIAEAPPTAREFATMVVGCESAPTAADIRRIVDALEKMATCAARAKP